MSKKFALTVRGDFALFTDPFSKIGGEKFTYNIPTYEAIKGILRSVFWKPTIIWIVDRVRVMNQIKTISKSTKPLSYHNSNIDIAQYVYLSNVEYQVEFHYEWNLNRTDMVKDRIFSKYDEMTERSIIKGGRQDVFLGTRECQGTVTPCVFGEGSSYYESLPELPFNLMFHSFGWPNENKNPSEDNKLITRLWNPVMKKGIIDFVYPEDCTIKKVIKTLESEHIETCGINFEECDHIELFTSTI